MESRRGGRNGSGSRGRGRGREQPNQRWAPSNPIQQQHTPNSAGSRGWPAANSVQQQTANLAGSPVSRSTPANSVQQQPLPQQAPNPAGPWVSPWRSPNSAQPQQSPNPAGPRGSPWRPASSVQPQPHQQQTPNPAGTPVSAWRSPNSIQPRPTRSVQPQPLQQQTPNPAGPPVSPWRSPNSLQPQPLQQQTPNPTELPIDGLRVSSPIRPSPPPAPGLSDHVTDTRSSLNPIRRPDRGGTNAVQRIQLHANHFPVFFESTGIIIYYDIDIKPEATKKGRLVTISKSTRLTIWRKLCSADPSRFPMSSIAYDGEKNVFSAVQLPTGKFKVEFPEDEDLKIRIFTITVNLVKHLEFCKLSDYLSGKTSTIPRDILQGMDVVMKENPASCMFSVGRSFYPFGFSQGDELGWGVIASRGFQHSLKPTAQCLSMCLDYSVMPFLKPVPVIDFLKEHVPHFSECGFRNVRKDVEAALQGLKVRVTHRKSSQKFVIAGLTKDETRSISFLSEDPEGKAPPKKLMLLDYFMEKYGKDIKYKDIPCLELGKNNRQNHVPMEFCILVEGQRYPKENLDKDAARLLKDMSLPPPNVRENKICEMVRSSNGPCGGGIIGNFGMKVDMRMTTVTGRVIEPPELKSGGPSNGKVNKITLEKDKCQWNLVGKWVVKGIPVDRWAVIDFTAHERYNWLDANKFIPRFIERSRKLGIRMQEPLLYETANMNAFSDFAALRNLLHKVAAKGQFQVVFCVMSRRDPGYGYLKWYSETQIGMVTQCCLSANANKLSDQTLANLGIKMNAKLGGSNVELINRLPRFEGAGHVMFIGADVNHPAAFNATSPSIAAVVATMNWPAANRYAARIRPQVHRTERILNFGEMCLELVETYAQANKVKPDKIVVFRDGVSESQSEMVMNQELLDLKKAIQRGNYCPTITLIVARKRHLTRLFPHGSKGVYIKGNVPPGTVVDTSIVHVSEFDFYLCSHYGMLGTSKPTHYHVLYDDHKFTSDQMQKLIYDLCFTFARCTKPVSLVPPVYYADLAAYRGRLYYEAMEAQAMANSSASSSSSSSSSGCSGASLDERSYRLHAALENQNVMFFV